MPVTDRSLRPITLIGWTAVFYIVHCTAVVYSVHSGNTTTCRAPSDYGPENKVDCTVSYTDNLVLECPDSATQTTATWRKVINESYSVALCNAEGPECSLNDERSLTNQDSGLYFCRIPAENGSDFHRAYVNISVLAPPSLLDVVYCEEESCTYSDINATSYEEFRVTVKWNGIGPFSVQWKHNDSDFYCNNSHCGEEKSTNSMSLVFPADGHPHPFNLSGYYSANVSNSYGSNVSRTLIKMKCKRNNAPVFTSNNSTVFLRAGADATLNCSLDYNRATWLTVCYGKHDQDIINEKNKAKYCSFCQHDSSGVCRQLTPKPDWKVYRKEERGCHYDSLKVNITVKQFSANDDGGKIFCFYGDSNSYYLYTTYTLNYVIPSPQSSLSVYIIVGIVCTCGTLLLTIVVASYIIWRSRKKREQRGAVSDIQHSTAEFRHESDPLLSGETSSTVYSGGNRPSLKRSHERSNLPDNPQNTPGIGPQTSLSYEVSNSLGFLTDTDGPDLDIPSDFLLDTNRHSNRMLRSSSLSSTTSCDPQSSATSMISSTSVRNPFTGRLFIGRDIDYHSLDLGILSDFFTPTDGKQSRVIYT